LLHTEARAIRSRKCYENTNKTFSRFFFLNTISVVYLVNYIVNHARPHFLSSVEETLNDTAVILASLIESDLKSDRLNAERIKSVLGIARNKEFSSRIFSEEKRRMNIDIYVVNQKGIVIYDSAGRDEGKDFSKWNDVYLTLRGKYGARSTRIIRNDPETSSFYIAAPIYFEDRIIGAVTVVKPKNSIKPFMENAKSEVAKMSGLVLVMLIFAGFLITFWFTRPITALTGYAENLRRRKKTSLPRLGHSEISILGKSLSSMHEELEGKKYVEDYIQTLTHEIKSPLSSIRAASELLEEGVSDIQREKLQTNIQKGIERISELTDRMLLLSSLENRSEPEEKENFDLSEVCRNSSETFRSEFKEKISFQTEILDGIHFSGEKFLIRQAVENLLRNASEFTPEEGSIQTTLLINNGKIQFVVSNTGPKIPDYALEKVYDKFFSLPRPGSKKRSSGLGLPFVKKVADLHGGSIQIENTKDGVRCTLLFPCSEQI